MNFKISDICEINSSNISAKDNYEYINYLDTSNLTEGVIDSIQKLVIGEDKIPSRAKRKVKKNDILISTVRPNQKHYGILRKLRENLIVSTGFAVLSVNKDKVDAEYLYRFLTQDSVTNYLQAIGETSTSTYPSIKPSDIGNLDIKLPTLQEQKAIAKVLSDLDEKIETNNKINRTLEEMAQAIFKQWFVDFEFPNEEGKPYKSSGGEMVESELGMIPKGWEAGNFREFTDTVLGGDWGKETEQGNYNKEVLCLRGADIPEIKCGKLGAPAKRFILERNYNNKKLNVGDLVVEISGGSPTQSTGRVTYVNEGILNRYDYDFVCTNFCRAITLKNKKYMEYFYFYWSYLYDLNVFFQYENGTTGIKNFDVNTFLDKHQIIIPPHYLLEKYHLIVSNKLNTIQHNGLENLKLGNIRDTLLPKLMSGEIRVPLGLIEN